MTIKDFKYLSGIKPTGDLTLGNYLGVIKPAVDLGNENKSVLMFIADLHAYTTPEYSKNVKEHKEQLIGVFNVFGLDYFIQSHIPEHNQVGYIMEFVAKDWELRNQIQYKEKKGKDTRVSLLTYPALMAADCIMYDIPNILVGEDQMPHMYLTKDLVDRFNKEFGVNGLVMPNSVVGKFPKIKDLRDPTKKMSKSSGESGCIFLFDDPADAEEKIKKAVTDSENLVMYNEETKPGISNLMQIYSGLTGTSLQDIQDKYADLPFPYGAFKKDVAFAVKSFLINFQSEFNRVNKGINLDLENELREKAKQKTEEIFKYINLK